MRKSLISICALILVQQSLLISAAKADTVPFPPRNNGVVFAGGDIREKSYYGYLGGVYALTGQLGDCGWLIRAQIGHGEYDYRDDGDKVDGNVTRAELQVGYEFVARGHVLSLFVGPDYQRNKTNPDDVVNDSKGSQVGAKFGLEYNSGWNDVFNVEFDGDISTANVAYRARLRPGWLVTDCFRIGPEVKALGSNSYNDYRVGGFMRAQYQVMSLTVSAGYSDSKGDNADGHVKSAYGALALGVVF